MASPTVTLEKAYFETLLRRAQFHSSGADFTTPIHVPTVTIPKSDHDSLLASARQYANLRRNLIQGGIAEETFRILTKDDEPVALETPRPSTVCSTMETASDGGALLTQYPASTAQTISGKQDYTFGRNANYVNHANRANHVPKADAQPRNPDGFLNSSPQFDENSSTPDGLDTFYDEESGNNDSQAKVPRQKYDKFCKRTILIVNLPESATHADIVEVVKGGVLLDVYLRSHDRVASVSFVLESAAQEFFRHSKRHDLYIKGRRVEIRWSDRQFILPGHVANKIGTGATRNLVVFNRNARHTEQAIRDDLEHIHNLVVIKVSFDGVNAHISTNSIHNAMFARTCMMSRSIYKASRIEWDIDECNVPFEKPQQAHRESIQSKKKDTPPMNRFHLLSFDDLDDDSQDELNGGISLPKLPTRGLVA